MIIYLYGKDTYRRGEKAKAIVGEYKKKHSVFTVQSFDLGETERLPAFKDALTAQSLFDPFTFIVATNPFPALTGVIKEFESVLRNTLIRKETVLLFVADETPSKAYDFLIEKPVSVQEFPILAQKDFEKFVFIEAKKRGVDLSPREAAQLAYVSASDSWRVISELDKRAVLGRVGAETSSRKLDFFRSVLALKSANQPRASLPLLERLLENEEPAAIFNVLASLVPAAEKSRFADYDVAIKTGRLEYEMALADYLLK